MPIGWSSTFLLRYASIADARLVTSRLCLIMNPATTIATKAAPPAIAAIMVVFLEPSVELSLVIAPSWNTSGAPLSLSPPSSCSLSIRFGVRYKISFSRGSRSNWTKAQQTKTKGRRLVGCLPLSWAVPLLCSSSLSLFFSASSLALRAASSTAAFLSASSFALLAASASSAFLAASSSCALFLASSSAAFRAASFISAFFLASSSAAFLAASASAAFLAASSSSAFFLAASSSAFFLAASSSSAFVLEPVPVPLLSPGCVALSPGARRSRACLTEGDEKREGSMS